MLELTLYLAGLLTGVFGYGWVDAATPSEPPVAAQPRVEFCKYAPVIEYATEAEWAATPDSVNAQIVRYGCRRAALCTPGVVPEVCTGVEK